MSKRSQDVEKALASLKLNSNGEDDAITIAGLALLEAIKQFFGDFNEMLNILPPAAAIIINGGTIQQVLVAWPSSVDAEIDVTLKKIKDTGGNPPFISEIELITKIDAVEIEGDLLSGLFSKIGLSLSSVPNPPREDAPEHPISRLVNKCASISFKGATKIHVITPLLPCPSCQMNMIQKQISVSSKGNTLITVGVPKDVKDQCI